MLALAAASCTGGGAGSTLAEPAASTPPATSASAGAGDGLPSDLEELAGPEWEPATRVEELLFDIDDDAGPTAQDAIDALGLVVEGVPGTSPTSLPPGEAIGATWAFLLVESLYPQLSPEQQRFVDDLIASRRLVGTVSDDGDVTSGSRPDASGLLAGPAAWATGAGLAAPAPAPTEERYVALLAEARQDLKAHLPGLPAHGQAKLYFAPVELGGMEAGPSATEPDVCEIGVDPAFVAGNPSDDKIRFFFVHELFHCTQYLWGMTAAAMRWVVEGSAEFAAIDVYRGRALDFDAQNPLWYLEPIAPLKVRGYSAWPLFENARVRGLDVYQAIETMVTHDQHGVAAQLAAGHLDGLLFRREWSTRAVRSTTLGPPWHLPWPTPDGGAGPRDNFLSLGGRGLGKYQIKGFGYYTHRQLAVTMHPQVDVVTATPNGGPLTTYTAEGTVSVAEGDSKKFCFEAGGCRCPEGTTSDAIPMIGREMLFSYAAAGQATVATVVASEWDPDAECRADPPRKDGYSNGDPHLVTFDGIPYDVMTLGEFVLARDPAGDFEVQTRHEAFGFGAGTTAVALRTGGGRVTVTMPAFFYADPPVVRVDGVVDAEPEFEVGGVRFTVADQQVSATWPDGSTVTMEWFLGWFVSLDVSERRAGRMEGLLGDADDEMENDLRFPDGALTDTSEAEGHESAFSLAWAVDETTSLFDYEPGQSVGTFRIPHPNPVPPPPEPEAAAACSAALGEFAAAHEVESCAFDVTVTGEEEFMGAYEVVVEERVTGVDIPLPPPPGDTTDSGPATAGVAGEPTLVLDDERPVGVVAAVEGTVLLVVAESCKDDTIYATVTRVGDDDDLAAAVLCDPTGVAGVMAGAEDEWINGEAYVWIPGSGDYEVAISSLGVDAFGAMAVYVDPTPTVLRAGQFAGGDERTLVGLADTAVYLIEPPVTYTAEGFDVVCAVPLFWTATFPDGEPWDLDFCAHLTSIDLPPTTATIPLIVFNRTGVEQTIRLTPAR